MAKGKRISRYKLAKIQARTVLVLLAAAGFVIGRVTKPVEVETVTETIGVPTYEADNLPEETEVFMYDIPLSDNLQRYIYEVCADEEIPVTLIMAMIDHESKFNPEAKSNTDDYGLMQINGVNHCWLAEEYRAADMLNPYQNVFCGIKIIAGYVKKYEGDYTKALMCYNLGEYGAKKAWDNGITSTSHTKTILGLMSEYEQEVKDNANSPGNE